MKFNLLKYVKIAAKKLAQPTYSQDNQIDGINDSLEQETPQTIPQPKKKKPRKQYGNLEPTTVTEEHDGLSAGNVFEEVERPEVAASEEQTKQLMRNWVTRTYLGTAEFDPNYLWFSENIQDGASLGFERPPLYVFLAEADKALSEPYGNTGAPLLGDRAKRDEWINNLVKLSKSKTSNEPQKPNKSENKYAPNPLNLKEKQVQTFSRLLNSSPYLRDEMVGLSNRIEKSKKYNNFPDRMDVLSKQIVDAFGYRPGKYKGIHLSNLARIFATSKWAQACVAPEKRKEIVSAFYKQFNRFMPAAPTNRDEIREVSLFLADNYHEYLSNLFNDMLLVAYGNDKEKQAAVMSSPSLGQIANDPSKTEALQKEIFNDFSKQVFTFLSFASKSYYGEKKKEKGFFEDEEGKSMSEQTPDTKGLGAEDQAIVNEFNEMNEKAKAFLQGAQQLANKDNSPEAQKILQEAVEYSQQVQTEVSDPTKLRDQKVYDICVKDVLPRLRYHLERIAHDVKSLGVDINKCFQNEPNSSIEARKTNMYTVNPDGKKRGIVFQSWCDVLSASLTKLAAEEKGKDLLNILSEIAGEEGLISSEEGLQRTADMRELSPAQYMKKYKEEKPDIKNSKILNKKERFADEEAEDLKKKVNFNRGRLGDDPRSDIVRSHSQYGKIWGQSKEIPSIQTHEGKKEITATYVSSLLNLKALVENDSFTKAVEQMDQSLVADKKQFDALKTYMTNLFPDWGTFLMAPEMMQKYSAETRQILMDSFTMARHFRDGLDEGGRAMEVYKYYYLGTKGIDNAPSVVYKFQRARNDSKIPIDPITGEKEYSPIDSEDERYKNYSVLKKEKDPATGEVRQVYRDVPYSSMRFFPIRMNPAAVARYLQDSMYDASLNRGLKNIQDNPYTPYNALKKEIHRQASYEMKLLRIAFNSLLMTKTASVVLEKEVVRVRSKIQMLERKLRDFA